MSVILPLAATWNPQAAGGVIRVACALASLVALMALPGCGCEGTATDSGCPESGTGTDAASDGGDAGMPGTDACPPQACTVGVECAAGMACIDGACADPAVVACPAAAVDWVGAPVAPIVAIYKLLKFDETGMLHVFFQDAAGGLNYGLYGNGEAIVQALPSPCEEAPITVDLSVPGEALLATIGRSCASGDDELAVWTITGVPGSATATREVLTGSADPDFDSVEFHWGSLARTAAGDFFGVDIEGVFSGDVFYYVNVGFGWQEDVFSPHVAETVDLAVRPDGTVAGEMVGRRVVREWNPVKDTIRTWMETVDSAGRVRIVRPETGGPKIHYMFDPEGNFVGTF